jgi:hypothetical protein
MTFSLRWSTAAGIVYTTYRRGRKFLDDRIFIEFAGRRQRFDPRTDFSDGERESQSQDAMRALRLQRSVARSVAGETLDQKGLEHPSKHVRTRPALLYDAASRVSDAL